MTLKKLSYKERKRFDQDFEKLMKWTKRHNQALFNSTVNDTNTKFLQYCTRKRWYMLRRYNVGPPFI